MLSWTRPLDFDFTTLGWIMWAVLVVYAASNARQSHRRARRARGRLLGAHVLGVRHHRLHRVPPSGDLRRVAGASARPRDHRGRDASARARASSGGTRRPRGSSWAIRDRSPLGGAMAGLALLARTQLLLPILAGLPLVETLSVIAQVVSYRGLPAPRAAHGADPPPLRSRRLVGVHGDRALLAVLRRSASRLGVGIFYADFLRFGTRVIARRS